MQLLINACDWRFRFESFKRMDSKIHNYKLFLSPRVLLRKLAVDALSKCQSGKGIFEKKENKKFKTFPGEIHSLKRFRRNFSSYQSERGRLVDQQKWLVMKRLKFGSNAIVSRLSSQQESQKFTMVAQDRFGRASRKRRTPTCVCTANCEKWASPGKVPPQKRAQS